MLDKKKIKYNISVLGSQGVGKTSLIHRIIYNSFQRDYDPTIENEYIKQLEFEGNKYILEIVDTTFTEEPSVINDLYKRMNGFILVYSIIDKSSYVDLKRIHDEIVRARDTDNIPLVVVGNKCDLDDERKISYEEGKAFSNQYLAVLHCN